MKIAARDGVAVDATFYAPQGGAKGAVLIAAAMSAPQSYYRAFAEWLAQEGIVSISLNPDSVVDTWRRLAEVGP